MTVGLKLLPLADPLQDLFLPHGGRHLLPLLKNKTLGDRLGLSSREIIIDMMTLR